MISALVVLFVTSALLTLHAERQAERYRIERGEQLGYALGELGAGLDLYLNTYLTKLATDVPSIAGVANAYEPTARELIELLDLAGVASVPPTAGGASYRLQVTYPSGCSTPQKLSDALCKPTGLIYIDEPVMRGATVDYVALGRAATVLGRQGGYARPESPDYLSFPVTVSEVARPLVSNPTGLAGILAWRSDATTASSDYLRIDGGNKMYGSLNLDGDGHPHDLQGVNNVFSAGTVNARNLDVLGNEIVGGDSTLESDGKVYGNATVNGWLQTLGSGLWTTDVHGSGQAFATDVRVTESLHVGQQLTANWFYFSNTYTLGGFCGKDREIAMGDNGQLLHCKANSWQEMGASENFPDDTQNFYIDSSGFKGGKTVNLGNWIFCRKHNNWRTKVTWNVWQKSWIAETDLFSGTHTIVCLGKL